MPACFFVAAALALAVVLALAGVLGQVLLVSCDHDTCEGAGACGGCGLTRDWLGVETCGSAAEKAGEGRGEDEVLTLVLFMKSSFLRLGIDPMPQEIGYEML